MLAAFLLACRLAVQTDRAQVLYGSVVGNVRDASGDVVPGAGVTLTNVDSKQSRQVSTNDEGGYDLPTITPGTYEIKVSKAGFATSTEAAIVVNTGNTMRVDVSLKIGAVTESVTVNETGS